MSRVFVFEPVKTPIESASVHGDIIYLWDPGRRRPSIWETYDLQLAIVERLKDLNFNPHDDYFAVVGAIVPITIVIATLQDVYGHYKLLYWHSEHREYMARAIKPLHDEITHATKQ